MKHKIPSLLLAMTLLSSTTSANAERYCYHNDWLYLAGGTVLGAAAGALTGYFAGRHQKGPRGKQGEQGPPGEQGEEGSPGNTVLSNYTDDLHVTATNLVAPDNPVQFSYEIRDPIGNILIQANDIQAGEEIPELIIVAKNHKLTGTYTAILNVTTRSDLPTKLAEIHLNSAPFSPAIPEKTWEIGEHIVVTAAFSPKIL